MHSKHYYWLFLSAFLIVCLAAGYKIYLYSHRSYLDVIRLNWGIELPKDGNEIYRSDSGPSFHGDGARCHIFQYEHKLTLPERKTEDSSIESVSALFTQLAIPLEYQPDLNHISLVELHAKEDPRNTLYLLYDEEKLQLIVLENFY